MATDLTIRHRDVVLLELLDRVLDKGVVVAGDLTISVADVDLIYLGLRVLLCSVETMEKGGYAGVFSEGKQGNRETSRQVDKSYFPVSLSSYKTNHQGSSR